MRCLKTVQQLRDDRRIDARSVGPRQQHIVSIILKVHLSCRSPEMVVAGIKLHQTIALHGYSVVGASAVTCAPLKRDGGLSRFALRKWNGSIGWNRRFTVI